MSELDLLAPVERPEPGTLLIDAVINRQDDLSCRLAQQWVHRRGLQDFEAFAQGPLLQACGADGLAWLLEQLQTPATNLPPPPRPALKAVLREAISEVMAPLQAVESRNAPDKADAPDPWTLVPLATKAPHSASTAAPAPAPADLAALRAWLHSDAA